MELGLAFNCRVKIQNVRIIGGLPFVGKLAKGLRLKRRFSPCDCTTYAGIVNSKNYTKHGINNAR